MRRVDATHGRGHSSAMIQTFSEATENLRSFIMVMATATGVSSVPREVGGSVADVRLCGCARLLHPFGRFWLLLIVDVK